MEKQDLTQVVVARKDDTVLEVAQVLRDTRARHLVIVDADDKPVGIISAVDVNNRVVAEQKDPSKTKAHEMMTKNIDTVNLNDDYKDALEKMAKNNTYSLPVTREGKLLGLIEFQTCLKKIQGKSQ